MFDSIGWGEVLVVLLAALFIFGPERLPTLAQDAASAIGRVRTALRTVRGQVDDALGPELASLRDLDPRRYHPKTVLREHLLADESPASRQAESGVGGSVG